MAILRGELGRPLLYEFPAGYRGWVVITYEKPTCPPLIIKNFFLVISISSSGRACTSSPLPLGWRYCQYEYVRPSGTRTVIPASGWDSEKQIWAGYTIPAQQGTQFPRAVFFVGSKTELEQSWGTEPNIRGEGP
ncbi:MAG: DUF6843 domain-containing protein [Candidatus Binatia bacterium]